MPTQSSDPIRAATPFEVVNLQRIQAQLGALTGAARQLKVSLMMAEEAQELPRDAKVWLTRELLQCVAIVEVRE